MQNGLEVIEDWNVEIPATSARLNIRVSGSKLFTGKAALAQAVELRRLSESLRNHGLEENAISLTSVQVSVSSGLLGRSSAAAYQLRVKCADISKLPSLLDAVSEQKSCVLQNIEWEYEGNNGPRIQAEQTALLDARARANQLAESLGVQLGKTLVVQEMPEHSHFHMPGPTALYASGGYGDNRASKRRASLSETLDGAELAPVGTRNGRLRVVFELLGPA